MVEGRGGWVGVKEYVVEGRGGWGGGKGVGKR